MVRRMHHNSRGVAALEFALTIPLFIAILAAIFYFTVALLAKFVILNAASSAARTCVIRQMRTFSDDDFIACAKREFDQPTIFNVSWSGLCAGSPPTVQAQILPAFTGPIASSTRLLQLTAGCRARFGRVMYLAGGANAGDQIIDFKVTTSMPFTVISGAR